MAERKRLRVGVLFGGRSGEHEVSLRSALTVMSAMDPARYEVVPIGIGRDGRWYLRDDAMRMLAEKTPQLAALGGGGVEVSLLPYPGARALVRAPEADVPREGTTAAIANHAMPGPLDVIFPIIHGTCGEDGTLQGLLELASVPYVGAGVLGSAIGMDKDAQKRLLRDAGLPVVRYGAIRASDWRADPEIGRRIADPLGYPVFVKPNALGSSIGVARVDSADGLAKALADSFRYDRKVLIEAACQGREFECAVLGNDRAEASVVGEIVVGGGHDFYSYESKYVDPNGAEVRIPADLPAAISEHLRALAVAAFAALDLRGMARVDFLATPSANEVYINEVNTIPGFTAISMYPKLWEASGLELPKLIDRLIALALEDFGDRAALEITYSPKSGTPRPN